MKDDKEKKKKKKKLKWYVKLFLIILIIIIYAFFIGTKGIFVKEYKITSNKITDSMHGFKILHFSDLHFASSVNKNDVKSMIKKINLTRPDIVVFTGDLVSKKHNLTSDEKDFLIKELTNINAELGKYYVTGEEDFDDAISILNQSGFINLESGEQVIYKDGGELLLIDDSNAKNFFEIGTNIPEFKILAIHNPNKIDKMKKYNFDIALGGHTHNGQINIPKVKELLINGKYTKNYQKVGNTKLFVNPGIGTSNVNVRLFNHPTMFLYRLNKASK